MNETLLEFISLMFKPFLACLILTGIHAYLGIHVVERGVIFVDLSLAQIAALGAIVAVLAGYPIHTTQAYLLSLMFTFIGAAIFSVTRLKERAVPQEAIIGIVYVVSAAASVLVLDKFPSEATHLKEMLVGNILFVNWREIFKTLTLYGAIGAVHFIFRDKFIMISCHPERAAAQGINIRLWDFLFYMTFGFVVTSSVEMAGVLLVFSFLIVPAVCAMLFTKHFGKRLLIGWALGAFASLIGVYASAEFDMPTGAAIVCVFGLLTLSSWIFRIFLKKMLCP